MNQYPKDIKRSLLATSSITIPPPLLQVPPPQDPKDKEVLDLLDSSLDPGFNPGVIFKGNFSRRAKIEKCSHKRNTNYVF